MKNLFLSPFLFVLFLLSGCEQEPTAMPPIRITPTIESRVTALNFEQGDCIALQIRRSDQTYLENAPLTHNGNYFVGHDLRWYGNSDEAATLIACYPYAAQGFPKEYSVATDQRSSASTSDLLGAVREGVKPTGEAIAMRFYHLFARLQLLVQNQSDRAIQQVTIDNTVPTATLDWLQLIASPKAGAVSKSITAAADGAGYTAVLVPQSATLGVTITTDDGVSHQESVEATLLGGKSYTLSLTLHEDRLAITLAGEIHDWEDGGDLGGEESPNPDDSNQEEEEEPAEPTTEGTLLWGDVTYSTRTIGDRVWMAENTRYLPADITIGAGVWYPSNNNSLVESLGCLYDYETATSLICPEGWRVPTKTDLETLIGSNCGTDFFTPAGMCNPRDGDIANYTPDKHYLISSTSEGSNCYALQFTQTEAVGVKSILKTNGYSLRLVKDK